MPRQANGSLIERDGDVVGSALIGQNFARDRYFHGRALGDERARSGDSTKTIDAPYNAANSSGSNLGPTSKKLVDRVNGGIEAEFAAGRVDVVPADAVTTSASGLDPHISPQFALAQVACVAKARGLPEDAGARAWSKRASKGASLGLIGEPRVNVLLLNLALDRYKSGVRRFRRSARWPPAEPTRTSIAARSGRAPGACATRRDAGKLKRLSRRGARRRQDLRHAVSARGALKAEGVDVVVGLVETHGRAETSALLEGLEILPRRKVEYRGRTIEEFDIDAALARKPKLILVDELAHTNAPDSRHPKR